MQELAYFDDMIDHCLEYAQAARDEGRPVVGIMCEYTPRELIIAAGGVPVCLCGGSAEMIAPAEEVLPANLCPLIKSTFGYHVTGENPLLEMADLIVAETTCDGKKKMYELMSQRRAMYVMELPQQPDAPDALGRWVAQLKRLKAFLENRYGVRITPARLRRAIAEMNRYRALRRRLAETMARPRPPITGRQLLDAKSLIWGMPGDVENYGRAIAALDDTNQPPQQAAEPSADRARNKVRVLLTGVPVLHGAEKVVDCIESCGGLVVCMENCTGLKPILEDVDEDAPPLEALARKYLGLPCSVMSPNDRRLESLRRLAAQYRPQCVIDLTWQACLTYDIESARVKQLVQEELRLPYLKITTDYSPLDTPSIALRVEALLETVSQRGTGT